MKKSLSLRARLVGLTLLAVASVWLLTALVTWHEAREELKELLAHPPSTSAAHLARVERDGAFDRDEVAQRRRVPVGHPPDVGKQGLERFPVCRLAGERKRDPSATCPQVLHRICDSNDMETREVVRAYKDGRLFYWDDDGKEVSIGYDRFETIFSEQKPSTG